MGDAWRVRAKGGQLVSVPVYLHPATREEAVDIVAAIFRAVSQKNPRAMSAAITGETLDAVAQRTVINATKLRMHRAAMEECMALLFAVREFGLEWHDVLPRMYGGEKLSPPVARSAPVLRLVKGDEHV